MSTTKETKKNSTPIIDRLIRGHFANSDERDKDGEPIASVSVSEKFGWAKRAEADLELVESRLSTLCQEVTIDDPHVVASRFRLRPERESPSSSAENPATEATTELNDQCKSNQPRGLAMFITTSKVMVCSIEGVDGSLGTVKDVYFDDLSWVVRYLVVDTGKWLPGRQVLLSPAEVQSIDWPTRVLRVPQTKQQIQNSPSINTDQPVSRHRERELAGYYNWPIYWEAGVAASPVPVGADAVPSRPVQAQANEEEQHLLRSAREVTGYYIRAQDGDIGHVEDLIVDDELWTIRYLVIDTRNWLPGKKVIVAPDWAESIRWEDKSVQVDLTREVIQNSPAFNPADPVNRQYEEHLYDYYGREKYWH